jgi:biotin carboxyl carrier protein
MMRRYTLDIRGKAFVVDVEEVAADQFQVVVDGEAYDVQLSGDEDLPEATITPALTPPRGAAATTAPAASFAAAARKLTRPESPPPAPTRKAAGGGAGSLCAPMPGVILAVAVKVGDSVVRGQEIAVLEAMKMQNVIRSPRDGKIAEVCVAAGQALGHGDAIVHFEP